PPPFSLLTATLVCFMHLISPPPPLFNTNCPFGRLYAPKINLPFLHYYNF
ncbi:predicted protein, partial [Nematostella vectensis]